MNYLAVFILVMMVFFLMSKKQIVPCRIRQLDDSDIKKIEYIKNNIGYIFTKNKSETQIMDEINKSNKKYLLLSQNESISEHDSQLVIYIFYLSCAKPCGFNAEYYYDSAQSYSKKIIGAFATACVNYIQMLRKSDVYSYYYVCVKKEDIINSKCKIQNFELSEHLKQKLTKSEFKNYILRNDKLKIGSLINFFFTIITGTIVTANVWYNLNSVINHEASIYNVIACSLIYVCYANLFAKLYGPMGYFRFIASYLFPIYIVVYVISTAYYYIRSIIGGRTMNEKKKFFISLILLIMIYIFFIILKK